MNADEHFMGLALREAQLAGQAGEIPVGAILVIDSQVIAQGKNGREISKDPTSHAEIAAIRQAAKVLGNWRVGGTLYVTLEPCPMCLGAILQARIETLVFGCRDPKAGALGSILNLQDYPWNHQVQVREGVLETKCKEILQIFFKELRKIK